MITKKAFCQCPGPIPSLPSIFKIFTKLTLLSCRASTWKHSAEEAIPGSDPASRSDCSRVFGNIWGRVIAYEGK